MARNVNCLEGIRCPDCGHEDDFYITATSRFHMTDEGSDAHEDVEYDKYARIVCGACGYARQVVHFLVENQESEQVDDEEEDDGT